MGHRMKDDLCWTLVVLIFLSRLALRRRSVVRPGRGLVRWAATSAAKDHQRAEVQGGSNGAGERVAGSFEADLAWVDAGLTGGVDPRQMPMAW